MADNRHIYGFRYHSSVNGGPAPKPIRARVASAYQGVIGATSVDINVGDPVVRLGTGYWALSAGDETTTGLLSGIVVGIGGYKNADTGYFGPGLKIPGGTTYTLLEEASLIYVIPVEGCRWECDVDDAVTATTEAAYLALVGENVDHVLTTGMEPRANPMLDISVNPTTTAQWRIVDISQTAENRDFSGAYVKLLVEANEGSAPVYTATGV